MVAPTFAAISALDSGTTTANRTPAVPSGVANGSFVGIAVMAASATNGALATDFASIVAATQANASAQAEWKRATGADAGTYSVPHTAAAGQNSSALAFRVEGELATGNPIGLTSSNSATGVTTIPTTSLGAGVQVDSLLVHVVWSFNARTYTPPAGFTRRTDNVAQRLHLSTMVSPGGATGNVNGTMGTAGMTGALLFEIQPALSNQTVAPTGIDSTATLGTPTIVPGAVTVAPTGIDSTATLGSPTIVPGAVAVFPVGIDSTMTVGTPTIVPGAVTVSPEGIDSTATLGTTTVTPGTFAVHPTGIDSSATLGTPTISGYPFVTATVYDHETGLPVGASATVQLFDAATGELLDTTTTDAGGVYLFHLPMGFTDDVFTVVRVEINGTDYQGVSEVCPVQT